MGNAGGRAGLRCVAVPVCGQRVLARLCWATVFCVAQVDPAGGAAQLVQSRVREPAEQAPLLRWLWGLGVEGVVCGGIHFRYRVALEAEGLWAVSGYRGEAQEVLEQRLREGGDGNDQRGRLVR